MKLAAAALLACASAAAADEAMIGDHEQVFTYLEADRLEYRERTGTASWDAEGWIGGDYSKFWWKTEGARRDGSTSHAELEVLYSRALTPWLDLQLGLRHDFLPDPSRTLAVAGIAGLLPYRIEIDAAAFLSDDGDLSARVEAEYDLLITQRLILEPRIEVNAGLQEVAELGIGGGLSTTDLGLRLRYEFYRKFAPYIGVAWQKSWGDTADFRRAAGQRDSETSLVAGITFWY